MKRSLYFKRNIINTILLVIVLFAVLALVMFAFVMKASGDDLKEAVISSYNRNINIHGNLTFGYFKDKDHYDKQLATVEEMIDGLKELDGIEDVAYEYATKNGYFTFADNIDDLSEFEALWFTDMFEFEYVSLDNSSRVNKEDTTLFLSRQDLSTLPDIYNATSIMTKEEEMIAYKHTLTFDYRFSDEVNRLSSIFTLAGVTGDNISYIQNGSFDILEGRMFTKEEVENGAKVIILPVNTFYIEDGPVRNRKVAVGDMIPLSINNEDELLYTEYYEVIGLHNGGTCISVDYTGELPFYIDYKYEDDYYDTAYISYKNLSSLFEKIDKIRSEEDLPLINNVDNNFERTDKFDPSDYYTLSDINIKLKDDMASEEYYDIISYLERYFSDLNKDSMFPYMYDSNVGSFSNVAGSIASLKIIFDVASYISVIAVFGTTFVLLTNEFKKRFKERAIWLSMGEKDRHIYKDFYLGYFMIGLISFGLGAVISYILSGLLKQNLVNDNLANNTIDSAVTGLFNDYLYDDHLWIYPLVFVIWILIYSLSFVLAAHFNKRRSIKEMLTKE